MKVYVWYWVPLLLRAVEGLAACPGGYQMHGGICYKAFDQRKTFLEAIKICSTVGGTLAMPKDNNTNTFLISLINDPDDGDSTREFRFGLVNQHEEGAWEWIDGTPIGNYSAWAPREPNNQGNCAEYSPTNTWNDGLCSQDRRFICQIMLAGCPDDYIYHEPSRVCYMAFNSKKNYADAAAECSSDGGTLAMPRNTVTNNFLIYLKNAVDDSAGFRFGLTEEGTWIWADGVSLGSFNAWGPYEPNNYGYQDEDCAEYFPGNAWNSRKNKWNDGLCSRDNRKFICQVIPAVCPDGYIYHEPSRVCYMAFNDQKNYDGAAAACSSDGGTLAMPRDTITNNFLTYLKNAVDNSAWFRFGLTDLRQEGTWMWADGVTLGTFDVWSPGEPNNHGQGEDCAEYWSRNNKWNDGPCLSNNRKFICQIIPTDDSTSAPSVGTERPSPSTGLVMEQSSSTSTIKPAVTSSIDASTTHSVPSVGTEMPSPSTVMENPSSTATIKPEGALNINTTSGTTAQTSSRPPDEEKKTPRWLVGVVCAAVVVLVIIAVVTVLLCRRKHNPGANVPGKGGNEMKNLATPERHDHAASEGTVDNIIYNTEDEGFVDNVIYNAGDDGTVDNIIYQGQDSKSNDQENAPESQYESVN